MRVAVITQGISDIIKSVVESDHEVVGIFDCASVKEKSIALKAIEDFYKDGYYSLTSKPINLKNFSKKYKIPYYYFRKGDNENLEKWMKYLQPDLVIVYSMSHLLKESVFNIPKFGTINIHNSYLPEYRGPDPLFWQYYDCALSLGVTIHYIDKGEDTGDIICQERVLISLGEKIEEVNQKLSVTRIKLLLRVMDAIEKADIPKANQSVITSTFRARRIKTEEYNELIKWDKWGVERVFHFLSGTTKYHHTLLRENSFYIPGRTIKILSKEKCNTFGYEIGKLYKESSKHFFVCKDGKIFVDIIYSREIIFNSIILNHSYFRSITKFVHKMKLEKIKPDLHKK